MSVITYIDKWVQRVKKAEEQQEVDYFDLSSTMEATSRDMQEFLESKVWKDMQSIIKGKLLGFRDALETTSAHNDIIHIQGEIYSMRTLLALPQTLHDELIRRESEDDDNA